MNEDHINQAAETAQPEKQPPQPEPTRIQNAWDAVYSFIERRPVRIAAKVTAAGIVLALGFLGYRHYQPSWIRES